MATGRLVALQPLYGMVPEQLQPCRVAAFTEKIQECSERKVSTGYGRTRIHTDLDRSQCCRPINQDEFSGIEACRTLGPRFNDRWSTPLNCEGVHSPVVALGKPGICYHSWRSSVIPGRGLVIPQRPCSGNLGGSAVAPTRAGRNTRCS